MENTLQWLYSYPQKFVWEENVTPLSNPWVMLCIISAYQIVIRVLRARIQKPVYVPTVLPAAHNLMLCLASLLMMLGCLYESSRELIRRGSSEWLACLEQNVPIQGPLYFWSYMYYLSKYWEFLDTIFLVLKAKDVSFLHFMHHTVVAPMAWLWLSQGQSMQQIGLIINCGVHVLMYFYYFLCTLKIYPKWKQLITISQIVQFSLSFFIGGMFCVLHFTEAGPPNGCSGLGAVAFNFVFNMFLLYLFVQFHRQTYKNKSTTSRKTA